MAVGNDVGDCVGCGGARVEIDRTLKHAVEIGLYTEVDVGLRASDGRSEVGVTRAGLDDGGRN
jgi:hypothetical protein